MQLSLSKHIVHKMQEFIKIQLHRGENVRFLPLYLIRCDFKTRFVIVFFNLKLPNKCIAILSSRKWYKVNWSAEEYSCRYAKWIQFFSFTNSDEKSRQLGWVCNALLEKSHHFTVLLFLCALTQVHCLTNYWILFQCFAHNQSKAGHRCHSELKRQRFGLRNRRNCIWKISKWGENGVDPANYCQANRPIGKWRGHREFGTIGKRWSFFDRWLLTAYLWIHVWVTAFNF